MTSAATNPTIVLSEFEAHVRAVANELGMSVDDFKATLPPGFQYRPEYIRTDRAPFRAALAKDLVYCQQLMTLALQSDGNQVMWDIAIAAYEEFDNKYGSSFPPTGRAAEVLADWRHRFPYGFETLLPSSSPAGRSVHVSDRKPFSATLAKDLIYCHQLMATARQSYGNRPIWDIAIAASEEFDNKYGRTFPSTSVAPEIRAEWRRRFPDGFESLLPSSSTDRTGDV